MLYHHCDTQNIVVERDRWYTGTVANLERFIYDGLCTLYIDFFV